MKAWLGAWLRRMAQRLDPPAPVKKTSVRPYLIWNQSWNAAPQREIDKEIMRAWVKTNLNGR